MSETTMNKQEDISFWEDLEELKDAYNFCTKYVEKCQKYLQENTDVRDDGNAHPIDVDKIRYIQAARVNALYCNMCACQSELSARLIELDPNIHFYLKNNKHSESE